MDGKRTKKPVLMEAGHSDEFKTPSWIVDLLGPYLRHIGCNTVWECAYGKGVMAKALQDNGFAVIGDPSMNFLLSQAGARFDAIVTNPPYSLKDEFLERCYGWKKPFALLMPLTALEGKVRGRLYAEHGIQLLIPNKRVNFGTPSGTGSGSWFATAWFTWGLELPHDLNFIDVENLNGR